MKKALSIILTIILIATLFAGCNKTKELTEGKDNGKLLGAWLLVNNTDGGRNTARYWEFKDGGIIVKCDYVEHQEMDAPAGQTYEEMPWPYNYTTYYIDKDFVSQEGFSDRIEKYPYSYTDGYGLEYQKNENFVVALTEKEGWHFEFINENKFILTTDDSEYLGYRLKEPLL